MLGRYCVKEINADGQMVDFLIKNGNDCGEHFEKRDG